MDSYGKTNRSLWDGWAELNASSTFYDVDGFRRGGSSLKHIELDELGPVDGKSLLHLQCHFGLDTLSWRRLGADVTGVDFSERAIATARALAGDLGLETEFVCQDVLSLDLGRRFDVVFSSYGTICWLGDLARWADVIARHLAPGGVFYLVEFHPLASALDESDGRRLRYPYIKRDGPARYEDQGNYAQPDAPFTHASYQWHHGIGDVVTSLLDAGLRLELLHEFPYSTYGCFPFVEEVGPDRWQVHSGDGTEALLFSLRARAAE